MLSVPSVFTTRAAKNSTDVRYVIKLERQLIASPYTTSHLYFSTVYDEIYDPDAGDVVEVTGSLLNDITISESLNLKSHTSGVGGFSIELADLGHANYSDLLATYDIYNRPIKIYIVPSSPFTADSMTWENATDNWEDEGVIWDESGNGLDDGFLVYEGVSGSPDYNDSSISIPIENSTFTKNLEIGSALISSSDKIMEEVPEDSLGEVKPIIYGNHVTNIGHTTTATNNFTNNFNLSPCILMGENLNWSSGSTGTKILNWYVSKHECKSIDEIWAYDEDVEKFTKLSAFNTVQNNSNGCIISHTTQISRYAYFYPAEVPSWGKVTANGGTISNEANIVDGNLSTYGTINAQDVEDVSEVKSAQIDVVFDNNIFYEKFENADITAINIYAKTNYSHQGSSGNEELDIIGYNGIFGSAPNYEVDIRGWTNDTVFNSQAFTDTDRGDTQPVIRFRVKSGYGYGVYPTRTLKIYGMFLRVTYTPKDNHKLYFGGQGKKDDGSGTITGSADALIESPSHIAEDIARNEMGLSSEIDTAAFDNVHSELSSWKMSFYINKGIDSKALLEQIALQSKSFYWFNASNKLSADTFYATETVDMTGIDTGHIKNINIKKAPLSDIVNKLYLNYYNDRGRKIIQIARTNDTSNTGSQARYNVVNDKVINADFIRDTTTAGLLADHWVKDSSDSFWSYPRNMIDCELIGYSKSFIALEVADVIQFDDSSLDSYRKVFGVSWSGKKFKIFNIKKGLKGVSIQAIEV